METVIQKIFQREEIIQQPPVLLDIGASGKLNPAWKEIAKQCYCIAFDADERDFGFIEKEDSHFKKLFIFNSVVTDKDNQTKVDFYLTKHPHCSSTLEPLNAQLQQYSFADLFEVDKKIQLSATSLDKVLKDIKLNYIDWFKADSQGTDLRLFKSLDTAIQNKVVIAEFEPGFIDAYKDEDTFVEAVSYMFKINFELMDVCIKGPLKMPSNKFKDIFKSKLERKIADHTLKKMSGWTELTFVKKFNNNNLTKREFILGWLFSTAKKHHSLAYSIALKGYELSKDNFFEELSEYSLRKLKKEMYSLNSLMKLARLGMERVFSK